MSETFSFNASIPDLPLAHFNWATRAAGWADHIGPIMRAELMKQAPKQSERLAKSIRYQRSLLADGLKVKWTANTPYAKYVVEGTKPHDIVPKAARALHIMDAHGEAGFAAFAHHPGSKPNDFPKRAADALGSRIALTFRAAVTEGL
ncbi:MULTISPECIES: HK97 gp10 family phage protein [Arthrobacter]|uniref:HK97 gp10 family phage protein n=1 Tax=Arthrobacter terricola TaxID=2547396 RepID=A0A4R5KPF8_9MICC|nr:MULTISPECIES: HK97 gp10 family phage protein [Arthrobacter]MBT8160991.1 HK97 gp10 family phage protein [Arthrobacter sp. GN70]TDF96855.1 HK97 gp10 family phage protein [Arthrobacter terricola]